MLFSILFFTFMFSFFLIATKLFCFSLKVVLYIFSFLVSIGLIIAFITSSLIFFLPIALISTISILIYKATTEKKI